MQTALVNRDWRTEEILSDLEATDKLIGLDAMKGIQLRNDVGKYTPSQCAAVLKMIKDKQSSESERLPAFRRIKTEILLQKLEHHINEFEDSRKGVTLAFVSKSMPLQFRTKRAP